MSSGIEPGQAPPRRKMRWQVSGSRSLGAAPCSRVRILYALVLDHRHAVALPAVTAMLQNPGQQGLRRTADQARSSQERRPLKIRDSSNWPACSSTRAATITIRRN